MIVFRRALRDRHRSVAWWAVAIIGLNLFTVALFPTIRGNADFENLARDLPPAMRAMFGFDDAVPLTSAAGYLQTRLFSSLLPLVLLMFGIAAGSRAIAGSEEEGSLEMVLMNPVSRTTLIVERFASVVVMVLVLTAMTAAAVVLFGLPFGVLEGVSVVGLLAACASAGLLALLHAMVAFAVGAASGRRAVATAAATGLAVVGYLAHGMSSVTAALDPVRFANPWHWFLRRNMLAEGVAPDALLLPLVVVALALPLSLWTFARRDLR